jgi:conjugative transfer pilus assembly protein TraH
VAKSKLVAIKTNVSIFFFKLMPKLKPFFLTLQAVLVFTLSFNISNANISNSMESFWGGLGENSNYTQGGVYKTQTNTYYSGPSVYSRSKVVSVNPVSIQTPSIRGGCNGIDMFAGSFSHINSDQFVKLLKAVGNNAKGLVFQMAIDTISPSLGSSLKSILATIEKINAMNLNSCDIAAGAVGGVYSLAKVDKEKNVFCKQAQTVSGRASDWASGVNNCGAGGETNSTVKNTNTPELANIKPSDINFAFEALKNTGIDNDLKNVFQSITGTIIKKLPNNDNEGEQFIIKQAKLTDSKFIDSLLSGGKLKVYKCNDYDKCLDVRDEDVNLSNAKALQTRIKAILDSITVKLNDNTSSLTTEEKQMVDKVSTIPIISMLKVKVLNGGEASAKNENIALSEIIAIELLYIYIDEVLNAVMEGTNSMKKGGSELEKFQNNLKIVSKNVEEKRNINLKKIALSNQVLNQIHEIEKVISKSSTSSIF